MSDTSTSAPGRSLEIMTPSSAEVGVSFTWRHELKLDSQARVSFPGAWRPKDVVAKTGETAEGAVKEAGPRFMLILWTHTKSTKKHKYIKGLTPVGAKLLLSKLDSQPLGAQEAGALRRKLFGNAIELSLDGNARLCLPPTMAREAGLTKDAVFLGTGGDFEIWEPTRLAEALSDEEELANKASETV